MSNWKEHLKFGLILQSIPLFIIFLIYIYSNVLPSVLEFILLIPVLILSPLFPDIDHQSSKITSILYLISVITLWIEYYLFKEFLLYSIILLTFVVLTSQFIKHRSITHNIWFLSLVHIIIALFLKEYISLVIISFVGMVSHLIKDKI